MTWETYIIYLAAVAAFFATPPDTSQLLIMSNSIQHGLRRSLWTVFGDLSANVLQMLAAAFGLAAIIATSASAFTIIKWLGVAYLGWIGLQLFLSKPADLRAANTPRKSAGALFRQGFFTSSANPYAVVFFAALFPQFIDPALPVLPQVAVLGATYLVVDGIILLLWGYLAVHSAERIKSFSTGMMNRVCGILMMGAAALLASKDFEPQK
ncbi:LysE family translocator [Ahrensia sp. R2A130]|uniref:LysE family translocator n=1 Tax=Ahrensia sp. R2A130 TaxID=744979 RepID=UPI0001E08C92|nr:LysE family translocator [Ahrensia sp. R2A130]EFL88108.1 homoserine/homoserine lactone efflux protein [Ahrensia sp. R2A130]